MSGIIGIANYKEDISDKEKLIKEMTDTLKRRGINSEGYYLSNHVNFGHRGLNSLEKENEPISTIFNEIKYTITYDGKIYNSKEIKQDLIDRGFDFETNSDAEILLKAYIAYGEEVCKRLNGVFAFAIWNEKKEELFLARDHFGIKPLYYTILDDVLIFASEVKAIFKYPGCENIIDKQGVEELIGIGPSHTPGKCPFKGILELEPANYISFSKNKFIKKEYWKIQTKEHTDSLEKTCEKIRYLIEDSIKKQLVSNESLGCLLSGGLDSSIIATYASKYYKEKGDKLKTFSVDYLDNEKNFIKNDFQPNSDNFYIDLMVKNLDTEHTKIVLDTPELFDKLKDSMIARDFPGMADVDSSYLLFFEKLKKDIKVALSGECSDEIFGGYPWYFRKDALDSKTFPWSIAIDERQKLLNEEIAKKINLQEYIDKRYNESLENVEFLKTDSKENIISRKLIYLTSNWFMQTLLDRTDRMCMYNSLEVRVPFCDYRIVEYAWNIPWEMKAFEGREKGLLRYAMKGILPEEVLYRKKSPYPKTYNPTYTKKVKENLRKIIENENSPINNLLNRNYIIEILETEGKAFTRPWFGQLMTGPQLMAYLIQVNMWLEEYRPKIEI